ncbi:MAG: helix-turn-helix domain-containing protein [bacterium]
MPKNTVKELYEDIGNKIKHRRMELKYSQEKLGELLDISYTAIQRYENASAKIPLDNLLKICRILEVDLSYFLKDSGYVKSLGKKNSSLKNNSEYYKHLSMLREIYESKSEDLISVANTGIENVYSALKKQKKPKTGAVHRKKSRLEGNS